MIKRESYMRRIRPFIGGELIKVMTGIRRCGKSVMLELVKQELLDSGVGAEQFITLNFEDLRNAPLCRAEALHAEILRRAAAIPGKAYLFFDEIQDAKLLSGELATYLGGRYVEFVIYPFSFAEFLELYRTIAPSKLPAKRRASLPIGVKATLPMSRLAASVTCFPAKALPEATCADR